LHQRKPIRPPRSPVGADPLGLRCSRVGVPNFGGVEAEFFTDGAAGLVVILFGDGVIEEELGFALGGVDFDGDGDGGTQEYAVFALFGDEEVSFFEGEALAEFGGDDEGSSFADAGGCPWQNL
jgi:hypothetical protein